jgi:hypothetical protein
MKLTSLLQNGACAGGLFLLLLAALGSKPNAGAGAGGDAGSTTTTSANDDPTEPKVSVSGKKVPNYEYIRGTCENVKKTGQCDEFYGLIPKFSPDMCKTEGGNFVTTTPKPNPCPKENLIGTCHYEQSRAGEPGQFANYYANNPQSAAALKKECVEDHKNEWIDPPAKPVASSPPNASAPPAAKAATTAKPAANGTSKAKTK